MTAEKARQIISIAASKNHGNVAVIDALMASVGDGITTFQLYQLLGFAGKSLLTKEVHEALFLEKFKKFQQENPCDDLSK